MSRFFLFFLKKRLKYYAYGILTILETLGQKLFHTVSRLDSN